ncbi:aldose epimerase family protein, partial [Leuconostoc mesenteroides]
QLTYPLHHQHPLDIIFTPLSTHDTFFNPITHLYFNLLPNHQHITPHKLQIPSPQHLQLHNHPIPTPNLIHNQNRKFDFADLDGLGEEH